MVLMTKFSIPFMLLALLVMPLLGNQGCSEALKEASDTEQAADVEPSADIEVLEVDEAVEVYGDKGLPVLPEDPDEADALLQGGGPEVNSLPPPDED